ncbi:hypothetical protein GCM10022419_046040 [Nonomuraea rosea]|uniref:Uncharacterized protein n=1 Tax=Nonomuraea rosea TaxID=638574 RepID=A0ABP6X4F5_9ACTN
MARRTILDEVLSGGNRFSRDTGKALRKAMKVKKKGKKRTDKRIRQLTTQVEALSKQISQSNGNRSSQA